MLVLHELRFVLKCLYYFSNKIEFHHDENLISFIMTVVILWILKKRQKLNLILSKFTYLIFMLAVDKCKRKLKVNDCSTIFTNIYISLSAISIIQVSIDFRIVSFSLLIEITSNQTTYRLKFPGYMVNGKGLVCASTVAERWNVWFINDHFLTGYIPVLRKCGDKIKILFLILRILMYFS